MSNAHPHYSRAALEVWREGPEWRSLSSHWLEELAREHTKELFRLRKGPAKETVKGICEEVLPLANMLAFSEDLPGWQGKLSSRGSKADALIRAEDAGQEVPIQIVGAFNGQKFAAQMRELNALTYTRGEARSKSEIDTELTELVLTSIRKKSAKGYPLNYWLIVGVDDIVVPFMELERLVSEATRVASTSTFERVYLVGMTERGPSIRIK